MIVSARPLRRRPGQFDTFLFADYSGASDARAQRAAISLFRLDVAHGQPKKVNGPFTRATLRDTLVDELDQATRDGRRVLFGIDHQWSWPRDLLAVAGVHRLAWRMMLERLVNGVGAFPALGEPSTYAAAFNRGAGLPVFYSRVKGFASRYGIPSTSSWSGNPVRLTETLMPGAKPSNRVGGTGAVAGQTLTGLAELHRLFEETSRRGLPVTAWPFEALYDDGSSHIGCEIYPGYCKRALGDTFNAKREWSEHDRDAAAVCMWACRTDLAPLLDLRKEPAVSRHTAGREGWILGATTSH